MGKTSDPPPSGELVLVNYYHETSSTHADNSRDVKLAPHGATQRRRPLACWAGYPNSAYWVAAKWPSRAPLASCSTPRAACTPSSSRVPMQPCMRPSAQAAGAIASTSRAWMSMRTTSSTSSATCARRGEERARTVLPTQDRRAQRQGDRRRSTASLEASDTWNGRPGHFHPRGRALRLDRVSGQLGHRRRL